MSLWKDRASGTYKFTFQVNGRVYGGGGHKTKAEARTAREDKRKTIISGADSTSPGNRATPTGFAHLADLYLTQSQRRHADKTFRYKKFVYAGFLKHAGDIPVSKINPYLVQSYLQSRSTNSNYNRHRKDLATLFEYARKILGVMVINPCSVIEKLPEERKPKAIPTQEEFFRMITEAGPEERPLLVILAYTAARIDEVLRLKWEDVNLEHGFIRLWTKKTRDGSYRAREIPMKSFIKGIMMDLWEKRIQDQWVFCNPKTKDRYVSRIKFMRALCKRLGIPHYGFHAIRHFVSSYLLDKEKIGKPTVGRMLGHQSLSTTDIYAHSIGVHTVDDALDMAMDKLEAAFSPKLLTSENT